MVVVAFNGGRLLLEAYVVEARKGRPVDILDRVVRNEEVFFPPHEDIFRRLEVRIIEVVAVERLGVVLKRPEFAPVFPVNFLVGIPFPREKRVLPADDLSVEERCERRVLLRKALDLQVAAEVRVGLVHMLKHDFDVVTVAFAFLLSLESGAVVEQRPCDTGLLRVGRQGWHDLGRSHGHG